MEYRTIGYVAGTHGIKGEIKVRLTTDFVTERFAQGNVIYLDTQGQMLPYTIKYTRFHKGMLLVTLEEIDDINQVENWRNLRLCVATTQLHTLAEDEIYVHDLMDMEVMTADHVYLGRVVEILDSGAHMILRIKGEREILIPYVKRFIKQVDVNEKRLIAELLEGM